MRGSPTARKTLSCALSVRLPLLFALALRHTARLDRCAWAQFSQHLQRVWLVGAHDDTVQKTYLVSGSVTDNLQPGTYAVYSRSRWATGVDDSGVMQYFVRFTQGPTGAAIGFHSIPTKDGTPLQTTAQLGTPQSHGCIRQWKPDAIALWHFAPVGTRVVVVA